MKVIDLFAGIGGFSLAAHWMNWKTIAFVERDPFCQKVLRKNFGRDIEIYGDITTFSGKPFRGRCDVVTGGFPCQPFSHAGKQKGEKDKRYLFPEMLRVISESHPAWVVAENVRGLLTNANGELFENITSSLENLDYAVQAFSLSASSFGAPHKRERIWIVANADGTRLANGFGCGIKSLESCIRIGKKTETDLPKIESANSIPSWRETWLQAATRIRRMDDGISRRLHRTARLKSLGNSIVPQIALEIFKAIEYAETNV